jgi:hypothetical protein
MRPGRHDWFYYTSTKCDIPDDTQNALKVSKSLLHVTQHNVLEGMVQDCHTGISIEKHACIQAGRLIDFIPLQQKT